jgi:hypothetical protein
MNYTKWNVQQLPQVEKALLQEVTNRELTEMDKELISLWNNEKFSRLGLRLLAVKLLIKTFQD